MVKRGRPSLNLTPEERVQRRRLQLVASQRKRRAHKRLAQLPKPCTESPESPLPVMPGQEALCQFYDAMFLEQAEDAVSLHHGSDASSVSSTAKISSPDLQPLSVCHHCGSAPLDMATLTAAMSSHSPASLLWTFQLGTDTYAPFSRLEAPMPPSTWADYPSATDPEILGIDQDFFADEHLAQACSNMPLFDSLLDSFGPGIDLHGDSVLGDLAPTKESDNIFLPGRFNREHSFWMPTDANEMPYSHAKAYPTRRPSSPFAQAQETGPMLRGDGADPLAPWAGTKQVSPALMTQNPLMTARWHLYFVWKWWLISHLDRQYPWASKAAKFESRITTTAPRIADKAIKSFYYSSFYYYYH